MSPCLNMLNELISLSVMTQFTDEYMCHRATLSERYILSGTYYHAY